MYVLTKGGDKIVITIYVDDILMAYSNPETAKQIKAQLSKRLELKDMGKPKKLLGIELKYTNEGIKLYQEILY